MCTEEGGVNFMVDATLDSHLPENSVSTDFDSNTCSVVEYSANCFELDDQEDVATVDIDLNRWSQCSETDSDSLSWVRP